METTDVAACPTRCAAPAGATLLEAAEARRLPTTGAVVLCVTLMLPSWATGQEWACSMCAPHRQHRHRAIPQAMQQHDRIQHHGQQSAQTEAVKSNAACESEALFDPL